MSANITTVTTELAKAIRKSYYAAGDAYETGKWEVGAAALGAHVASADLARALGISYEVETAVRLLIGVQSYTLPLDLASLLDEED